MVNDKYKVVRVSLPTYGYLMNHKTLHLKSMDSVICNMIENKTKLEAKITALEDWIEKFIEQGEAGH